MLPGRRDIRAALARSASVASRCSNEKADYAYGVRALRSMFCLLCVFIAGSALMRNYGLRKSHSWPTGFIASAQSIVPGLSVSARLTSTGEAFQIALRILGPVLLGLALMALRNRVAAKTTIFGALNTVMRTVIA